MANIPYPEFGNSKEEIKGQGFELIRKVYEEKVGGADLGDVFSIVGDTLTLSLDVSNPGLQKEDGKLSVIIETDGGLQAGSNGLGFKLSDSTLSKSGSGVWVTTPSPPITGVNTIVASNFVIVNTASIKTNSRVLLTYQNIVTDGAQLWVQDIVDSTSFRICSQFVMAGTTYIAWMILN